jgi:hypothetical protein
MIKARFAVLLAVSLTSAVSMAGELYRDAAYGFSIAPPVFPVEKSFGMTVTAVNFQGAIRDGGIPSCNVQIQNVNLTPQKYKELSMNQFSALGLTLDSEESRMVSRRPALFWRVGNTKIKSEGLAVFDTDRVYLVTCLAAATMFDQVEPTFAAAIDSFKIDEPSK